MSLYIVLKIKGMLPVNNLYFQQKHGGTYIALKILVFEKKRRSCTNKYQHGEINHAIICRGSL